jgi:hypothetical protein
MKQEEIKQKAKFETPLLPVEEDPSSEKEDELPVVEAVESLKREFAKQQEVIIPPHLSLVGCVRDQHNSRFLHYFSFLK